MKPGLPVPRPQGEIRGLVTRSQVAFARDEPELLEWEDYEGELGYPGHDSTECCRWLVHWSEQTTQQNDVDNDERQGVFDKRPHIPLFAFWLYGRTVFGQGEHRSPLRRIERRSNGRTP